MLRARLCPRCSREDVAKRGGVDLLSDRSAAGDSLVREKAGALPRGCTRPSRDRRNRAKISAAPLRSLQVDRVSLALEDIATQPGTLSPSNTRSSKPFGGEKDDAQSFLAVFGAPERDSSLTVPE